MERKLKKRDAELKFKVALEALKAELSISQIASKYDIHPKQVTDWRDQLLNEGEMVFIPKTSLRKTKFFEYWVLSWRDLYLAIQYGYARQMLMPDDTS